MRHLDLFSGIGGFALAASWVWGDEHEIVSFCDNDKAAQIVLKHHWPGVPIHDDITTLDATKWRGTVDLVTGGFPCQPFSCAGKRRGAADDRALWGEMFRVIKECQPRWVLGENVAGIRLMELDKIVSNLEGASYEAMAICIPAYAVRAPQLRHRWFVVAHSGSKRYREPQAPIFSGRISTIECNWWNDKPGIRRVANGVSFRVDRLRLLGNAIVPQVAAEIFRCMKAVDKTVLVR